MTGISEQQPIRWFAACAAAAFLFTVFCRETAGQSGGSGQPKALAVSAGQEDSENSEPAAADDPDETSASETAESGSGTPSDSQASKENEAADLSKKRLEMLLAATFDRRPETILKAWAGPDPSDRSSSTDSASSPKETPDGAQAEPEAQLKAEVAEFQRSVTLGQWDQVAEYLSGLPEAAGIQVFDHLIRSLARPPASAGGPQQPVQGVRPGHMLIPADILALADACPQPLKKNQVDQLGALLARSLQAGCQVHPFVEAVRGGTRRLGGDDPEKRVHVARMLMRAFRLDAAAEFLPDCDAAETRTDPERLELLARYHQQVHQRDGTPEHLEKAWEINQTLLALPNPDRSRRDAAVRRAVDLSTRIREEIGETWLRESFTKDPERGKQILANIGSTARENLVRRFQDAPGRLRTLTLQNAAAEMLAEAAPELAEQWQSILTLLAQTWLDEAEITKRFSRSTGRGPVGRVDRYGNFYYVDEENDPYYRQMRAQQRIPTPIEPGDLLMIRPGEAWLKRIDDSLPVGFQAVFAQLYLKINEEDKAFPCIERVAATHPQQARDLVHEFLETWARNHDPNAARRRRNPYIYMYGFDVKADSIPLTRSKQERNLAELSRWVERIRALPIEPIDEKYLADAFTNCHSNAEVFRLEAFETVFGNLDTLQPETIARLADMMRTQLATTWRRVKTQEENKTKRSETEVRQEVLRGYEVAREILDRSLQSHPDHWQLHLQAAAVMFDHNAYMQSVQKSSEFTARRDAAFERFQKAADLYRRQVGRLKKEEQSTDVYDRWFYAALGACDLGAISHESVPDLKQVPRIRAAIQALPGELAEDHLARFANQLFTRMSPLKPEVKFRYLKAGMEIVGDHPRAWEARAVLEYYQDLVTEIRLVTRIDGSDRVGHGEPFGLFVYLLHTTDIERESGGFQKYVQNQNSMTYAYNYGRPTEDYRSKFEEAARAGLSEHFDVQSIVFESPKTMKSRPSGQEGWRITPYAYILMKARGSQVDRIPSLKLDLDFLDTSGYAVLPIESPLIPIDASDLQGEPHPMSGLQVVQTLDERQADEGRLILEIEAAADGLVPPLEEFLDLNVPLFEVVSVDDQGVSPVEFVSDSDDLQVRSDRSWTVELAVDARAHESPREFTFCSLKVSDAETTFRRYEDADLVEVASVIPLERRLPADRFGGIRWAMVAVGTALLILGAVFWIRSRPRKEPKRDYVRPETLNPFTTLGLLHRIRSESAVPAEQVPQLDAVIRDLEHFYFSGTPADRNGDGAVPDLERIVDPWLEAANSR